MVMMPSTAFIENRAHPLLGFAQGVERVRRLFAPGGLDSRARLPGFKAFEPRDQLGLGHLRKVCHAHRAGLGHRQMTPILSR